jgi:hypothetical protein
MNKQTYIALVALNVHHVLIVPGASVELTDEEAAGALVVNAVTTQAALDAAAAQREAAEQAAHAAMQANVQAADPVEAAKDAAKAAAKAGKASAAK